MERGARETYSPTWQHSCVKAFLYVRCTHVLRPFPLQTILAQQSDGRRICLSSSILQKSINRSITIQLNTILYYRHRDITCIEQHKNKHNYFIRVSFIILIKFTRHILCTYTHNVNVVSYLLCVYLHYNLPRTAACNGSRLLLLCFIRIWCLACWIINA